MKVAIVSDGNTKAAKVSKVFARCSHIAIYDTNTEELENIENPFRTIKEQAGVEVVKLLIEMGVKRIIGYEFGSKARKITDQSLIQLVVLGRDHLTVQEVLQMLKSHNHQINN